MDRKDLIWGSIRDFANTFHEKPTHIIMHPSFYDQLRSEFWTEFGAIKSDETQTVFGLKIFRSLDISKDTVKVFIGE